jgi:hypothetical protein
MFNEEEKGGSVNSTRAIAGTVTGIRAVSIPAISFFGFLRVFVPLAKRVVKLLFGSGYTGLGRYCNTAEGSK